MTRLGLLGVLLLWRPTAIPPSTAASPPDSWLTTPMIDWQLWLWSRTVL